MKQINKQILMTLATMMSLGYLKIFAGEDGINIDRCENVYIEDCFVTSNDDPMCIKSGPDSAFKDAYRFNCRNITTTDCVIFNESYRALQIGAEASADFEEDIVYRNMYIVKAGSGINIGLTYRYPDKSMVRNIRYENIYMERGSSIILSTTYMDSGATLDGVYLKNIVSHGDCKVSLNGQKNYPVSNITFENLSVNGTIVNNSDGFTIGNNVNNVKVLVTDDTKGYLTGVQITSPASQAFVLKNKPLQLTAACYEGKGTSIQKLEYFVNGQSVGTVSQPPWQLSWTPKSEGPAQITATVHASGSNSVSTLYPTIINVIGASVIGGLAITPPAVWLKPGEKQNFSALIINKQGIALPTEATVQWSGHNVNSKGYYTAPSTSSLLKDSVEISIDVDGVKYSAAARVQVSNEPVQGIVVNTKPLNITKTLTNFPLLVRLSDENFDFTQSGSRPRLRFTTENGTQLAHQVESWDATSKQAAIWVRIPEITPTTNWYTVLLHWTKGTDGTDYDSVFRSADGFEAVWHMASTADARGAHLLSSSKVSFVGSSVAGTAIKMDTTQGNSFTNSITYQPSQQFTVSGWMKTADRKTTLLEGQATIFGFSTPGGIGYSFIIKGESYYAHCKDQSMLATAGEAWNHVAVTRAADGTMSYYFNGRPAELIVTLQPAKKFVLDQLGANSQNSCFDEVRIENVVRSSDWIRLCYETQKPSAVQDLVYGSGLSDVATAVITSLHATSLVKQMIRTVQGGFVIDQSGDDHASLELKVFTLQGRLIYAMDPNYASASHIKVAPGMYIVRYKIAKRSGAAAFRVN